MRNEIESRSNIITFPSQKPLIIGNNALKAEYWENPRPVGAQIIDLERYRSNPLRREIEYLDAHWEEEELPRDWYRVDDVGFSSQRQMRLLKDEGDVSKWAAQTGQDLLGFGLEYLRQGTVFPFEYHIEGEDLVDTKYGSRKMIDTVDPKERGGKVLGSLKRIQAHLLGGEDGTTAIMISPPGFTDLTMDDGSPIVYTDTMVFHMQIVGERVIGTTFRVGMNLSQAKSVFQSLTGESLALDATAVDCVSEPVLLNKEASLSASSLIDILEDVKGSRFSYEDRTFDQTRRDLERREELYCFDQITHVMIDDFKDYVTTGVHSDEEIQKAIAATFLRISRHLLVEKPNKQDEALESERIVFLPEYKLPTMGMVLNKVRALPGCMGGGRKTSVESIISRSGAVESDWKDKANRKYDKSGPCVGCGRDVGCGPCKLCKDCNDQADLLEAAA